MLRTLTLAGLLFGLTQAWAAPWAEVGDVQLRSDIETLAMAGVIDNLTTEWPVPWTRILDRLAVSGALNSPTESYTFTVASLGNTALFTQSGTFDSSAFNTSQFQFTDQNTTGNGYFNSLNLTVESVPEPGSVAIFAMSGLGMLLAMRRKK